MRLCLCLVHTHRERDTNVTTVGAVQSSMLSLMEICTFETLFGHPEDAGYMFIRCLLPFSEHKWMLKSDDIHSLEALKKTKGGKTPYKVKELFYGYTEPIPNSYLYNKPGAFSKPKGLTVSGSRQLQNKLIFLDIMNKDCTYTAYVLFATTDSSKQKVHAHLQTHTC